MARIVMVTRGGGCVGKSSKSDVADHNHQHKPRRDHHRRHQKQQQQISMVDSVLSALRKSMVSTCSVYSSREDQAEVISSVHHMEIGWPTDVQHITHVNFDRSNGFLGLPVELELEVPCTAPSASVRVCGVSTDTMQRSYDKRGTSVPTILLLMQERLYAQGGLKAEGIFRINPENSKQEHVKDQLNRGIVPEDIDVHCLAGLIKSWFRELPSGVLDGFSPEQVLQCNTEAEFVELIKQLKPNKYALLRWAVDLMADVVEQEEFNKMNARNIAMVFAPNMTQMSDPLTALMHAVQVMNLLKTLIIKTLREREEAAQDFSDEDYNFQQDMEISCVSIGSGSDEEDAQARYGPSSEDKDEVESLSEIEYCFLRQLDENENAKDGFRKQLERILCRDNPSPRSGST